MTQRSIRIDRAPAASSPCWRPCWRHRLLIEGGSAMILIAATAIACAVVSGVFFAFSSFVMRALTRIPPEQGIAAMQSINIVVINPVFMTALFGTGIACAARAVYAAMQWQG